MKFFYTLSLCFFLLISKDGFAATYYVSAVGNDAGSGSLNAPFKTIEKGLSRIGAGDSLLLRKGDTWVVDGYLSITKPNVTLGAYAGGNGTNRPIIDGRKANRGGWNGKLAAKADNVTIRDLEIRNSGSIGLRFNSVKKGLAENVKVQWTYRHGIQSYHSSNVIIRNCEVVHHNNGWKYYGEPTWGNGISVVYSNDAIVEKNTVREGFGEGIDSFYGSKGTIIQDNFLYANRAVGIYVDSTQGAIVRRNVVLGTTNALYHRGGASVGHGIALNNEKYQFSSAGNGFLPDSAILKDVRIYNNLVAFNGAGMGIWGQHQATNYSGVIINHNTFVDNDHQLVMYQDKFTGDRNIIANNIFLSLSAGSEDYNGIGSVSNMKFASNTWSIRPKKSFLNSSTDVIGGAKLAKMAGWRKISSQTSVSSKDFIPLSDSSTLGKGTKVGWSDYSADFNKKPVNIGKIDIGAFQFGSQTTSPPSPPHSITADY
jgi:hypothetical protein